jgi:hypothetical protein
MKVTIPGFVAPLAGARVDINGKTVFLRPKDRWPIFEEGASELKGIEHLMGPLTVDFPAKKASTASKDKTDEASKQDDK